MTFLGQFLDKLVILHQYHNSTGAPDNCTFIAAVYNGVSEQRPYRRIQTSSCQADVVTFFAKKLFQICTLFLPLANYD